MSSSFDRLVARALRQPSAPGTPCPTAEMLAAYLDGSLPRADHAAVEQHASRCDRCAAHLAALVQLEDQLAAGEPPLRPWWQRRPWLVPAAAAILAGVVWTSLPRERVAELTRPAPLDAPAPAAEQAPAAAVGDSRPVRVGGGAAVQAPTAVPAPPSGKSRAAAPKPSAPFSRLNEPESKPKGVDDVSGEPPALAETVTPPPAVPSGAMADSFGRVAPAAPRNAPPPAPEMQAAATPAPAQPAESAGRRKEGVAADSAAIAPRTAPAEAAGSNAAQSPGRVEASPVSKRAEARERDVMRQRYAAAPAGGTVIVASGSPLVAWRVAGSRIERSIDGAATWQPERAPDVTPPVVGSAPSADACWIAGADGGLLRREAGGRWTRVSLPAGVRIVGIAARSALGATLLAADGRRLTTSDGGVTWIEVR